MKHKLLFASVLMLSLGKVSAVADPVILPLEIKYVDPTEEGGGRPRTPVLIPNVEIDGSTVFFITPCDGNTLLVLDETGTVVYSTTITEECDTLELPSILSGEYEIQIIRGAFCFYGYITL